MRARLAAYVLLAALVLLLPAVAGPFLRYLVLNMLLLALLALSFNLLFGMTGLLSFGQGQFDGGGAYSAALLLRAGVPLLWSILLGALAAAALAAVLGAFCVRHTRVYFSMLTLAFGMLVHAVLWKWTDVTGGDDGLIGIPRPELLPGLHVDLVPMRRYYVFAAAVAFVSIVVLHRLAGSPLGLALRAIRENAERAEFSGVPVRRTIFVAFVVAGAFAGVAGALLAPLEQTVAPAAAHWTKSAEPVMSTLIGGPLFFAGPIAGAALYLGLKEIIVRYTEYWLLIFGLVLLGLVLSMRGGVLGAVSALLARRGRA